MAKVKNVTDGAWIDAETNTRVAKGGTLEIPDGRTWGYCQMESIWKAADKATAELRALVAPADAVFLDAKIEAELQELDDESAAELLESIGQTERGLDALARAGFHTLRLQTYLTAGPKESRAWTIHQGDTAPKAAGVIHTDFEKGFIRAETIAFEDYVVHKGEAGARDAGKLRLEGKEYVVKDGDVLNFLFNV
mgnify:CR=1 FL=1